MARDRKPANRDKIGPYRGLTSSEWVTPMSTFRFAFWIVVAAGCHTNGVINGGSVDFGASDGATDDGGSELDVEPQTLQTIVVATGAMTPTAQWTATVNGVVVSAIWTVDRGDIGTISVGSTNGVFTPKGATGGLTNVTASYSGKAAKRQVLVQLVAPAQNGANTTIPSEVAQIPADANALKASGGVGGVGGEGLGGAVTDPATLTALATPTDDGTGQSLVYLYPYDKTIWPRGMLAPLLMWSWMPGDADAIKIDLSTTSGSFSWSGTFGRPSILGANGKFIRHPIPQDVWDMATNTAGGATSSGGVDQLTVHLTVAQGGIAHGPIAQTWTVAPARLTGTVYYNSYATQMVKNWSTADHAGNPIGAAILGIRSGDTGPHLVAGKNSNLNGQGKPVDDTGCRVCHVVASHGRWLITQSEGASSDSRSYLYDLNATDVQGSATALTPDGVFAWAAMLGDGSYVLTNAVDPSSSNPAITNSVAGNGQSSFWQFGTTPQSAAGAGLTTPLGAAYPSFSPDDHFISYIDTTGHTKDISGALVIGAYDSSMQTFSQLSTLHSAAPGQRLGFPAFLPDNSGVLFETQVRSSQQDTVMVTRSGARSELWWTTVGATPTATALTALNGHGATGSYLPIGANNHGTSGAHDPDSNADETGWDDTTLNYEPTVLPVVAGGYAWVVFTSRRLYGNQLTSVPWNSWPPFYDTTDLAQATVKKLWVAAIDLSAPAGADPSHPAFYLPAQEILAGNSRGFWVLDPCRPSGGMCDTGDQCCGGYCQSNGIDGTLVCSDTPPQTNCSGLQDKCTLDSDCCDPTNSCINGFCAQQPIF